MRSPWLDNSPDQHFIRPDVPGDRPEPEGGYKDALGRMNNLAAHFRLYGLDAEGRNLAEVTADQATIRWTVALPNRKAAWRPFDGTTHVERILEHDRPRTSDAQTSPQRVNRARRACSAHHRSRVVHARGPRPTLECQSSRPLMVRLSPSAGTREAWKFMRPSKWFEFSDGIKQRQTAGRSRSSPTFKHHPGGGRRHGTSNQETLLR